MDIVSRLKMFLQENGISNSLFADNCAIPRPTLSQLLNGRNKKVSDELIAKIHSAYPSLNIMWLMFGDGDMFVPNQKSDAFADTHEPVENGMDFSGSNSASASQQRPTTISFGGEAQPGVSRDNPRQQMPPQAAFNDALQNIVRSGAMRQNDRKGGSHSAESRVVSIMVFYNDGRFETFTPQ